MTFIQSQKSKSALLSNTEYDNKQQLDKKSVYKYIKNIFIYKYIFILYLK